MKLTRLTRLYRLLALFCFASLAALLDRPALGQVVPGKESAPPQLLNQHMVVILFADE